MKKSEILARVQAVCRTRHLSLNTERAYMAQAARFFDFCAEHPALIEAEDRVRAWLEDMAPNCAAKTQAQALNAIVFLHRFAIERPLGQLGEWSKAKIPRRLPVWLTVKETQRVLTITEGTHALMLHLTYGCGLRLMEVVRLRVKDIDLERGLLTIRVGKGNKDRTLPLPSSLTSVLAGHLSRVRALWEGDAARGFPPVHLPNGLERKYPNAGREWPWFWAFPGRNLSRDPRTKVVRRHHTHEDGLSKALKAAVLRAGIHKRVTMHVLRHSYATHQLERGVPLHRLRDLLGHADITSTEIYLHVLPKDLTAAGSPLDDLAPMGRLISFPVTSDAAPYAALASSR